MSDVPLRLPSLAVRNVLGTEGRMRTAVPLWEERIPQLHMAAVVEEVLTDGGHALIEAATGTGKTLAYLVPALQSGRRVLVSTATKTLQAQIFDKDVPLLQRVLPRAFKAVLLKGRQNYVCLYRLDQLRQGAPPTLALGDALLERANLQRITTWAAQTTTGDRAELDAIPEENPVWREVTVGAEACLGRECKFYEDCFVTKVRAAAAEADVVVVNHHLFFADARIRMDGRQGLLPDMDAVVFDEAHHVEEVAAQFFSRVVSDMRVYDLLADLRRELSARAESVDALAVQLGAPRKKRQTDADLDPSLAPLIATLTSTTQDVFGWLGTKISSDDGRIRVQDVLVGDAAEALAALTGPLQVAAAQLAELLKVHARLGEVGGRLAERLDQIGDDLTWVLAAQKPGYVYLLERGPRAVFLRAVPVHVAELMKRGVLTDERPVIFTSATLSTDGDFRYLRRRVGLGDDVRELVLPPVFDYMKQAMFFVPQDLPEPTDPQFIDRVAPTILQLVTLTRGRAFLLFTSWRNLHRAVQCLRDKIPYTTLVQGERGRDALLEAFRHDEHSVLFGVQSFWEGVDVPGNALSLVVIDKLPFANQGDPVVQARVDAIRDRGGNPFAEYTVPDAVITLKQGVGRLIRHRSDTGIITLLDNRIRTRSYGQRFLESLPRLRRTSEFDMVQRWWQHVRPEG